MKKQLEPQRSPSGWRTDGGFVVVGGEGGGGRPVGRGREASTGRATCISTSPVGGWRRWGKRALLGKSSIKQFDIIRNCAFCGSWGTPVSFICTSTFIMGFGVPIGSIIHVDDKNIRGSGLGYAYWYLIIKEIRLASVSAVRFISNSF